MRTSNEDEFVHVATDREGQFILEGLPDGPQRISLTKAGYESSVVSVGEDAAPERYILTPTSNADRKAAPSPCGPD